MWLNEITKNTICDFIDLFFNEKLDEVVKTDACENVFNALKQDEEYYNYYGVSLKHPSPGLYALALYRIGYFLLHKNIYDPIQQINIISHVRNFSLKEFKGFINPNSVIEKSVVFNGINFEIGENVLIGEECVLYNNIFINDINKYNEDNFMVVIGKNCVLYNNVQIYGKVVIGKNVVINGNVILHENIDENSEVQIINQLQIKSNSLSQIPSQKVKIYGLTKKFKNTIILHGESFYNPKIIIRDGNKKEVNSEVFYWDKNKIIIKIKYAKITEQNAKHSSLILMSNGNKMTLINNLALESMLSSLCE